MLHKPYQFTIQFKNFKQLELRIRRNIRLFEHWCHSTTFFEKQIFVWQQILFLLTLEKLDDFLFEVWRTGHASLGRRGSNLPEIALTEAADRDKSS